MSEKRKRIRAKPKYAIVLFCNQKRVKYLYRCDTIKQVYEYWHEFRTQKKPRYIQLQSGKRNNELIYELGLVIPINRWTKETRIFTSDSLGRNIEITIDSDKSKLRELIPYWKEELIYDFDTKTRIRYHEMMNIITPIKDIAQIFTLNNKLFLQVEDNIRMFGNKNLSDTERLFELVKEDINKSKCGNFIFVKDITTHQRKLLYEFLESKGFNRRELFRHYSY